MRGLRYFENFEFRLVREALRVRDDWIQRAPHLAKPLRLVMTVYRNSKRSSLMIGLGMFLYGHLAGRSLLPKARRPSLPKSLRRDPDLKGVGLQGGFEYLDGQMDDRSLGLWVAEQAKLAGACTAKLSSFCLGGATHSSARRKCARRLTIL